MKIKFYFFLLIFLILKISCNNDPYLFQKFPRLKEQVSYISFCDLPTPVQKLENLGNFLGLKNLFIKRDDLTGSRIDNGRFYGGNKPRKLEFLLADALKKNAEIIITYGCIGSNHALATAVYSNLLKLKSILMLRHQPNSDIVRNNLLLDQRFGSMIKFFPTSEMRDKVTQEILSDNKTAYFIPTGGSNCLGCLGFVNAAFELKEQINTKQISEPDLIYLACGSCGTTAGLLLGLKAANVKSKIVAVCVCKDDFLNKINKLFYETNKMLNEIDSEFPIFEFPTENLILNKDFGSTGYGVYTSESMNTIKIFKDLENINLEGTYSAKVISAILHDSKIENLKNKTILFWNTYCGLDFSELIKTQDYKNLPQELHKYFEEEVQSN